jgi:hypothetical protein
MSCEWQTEMIESNVRAMRSRSGGGHFYSLSVAWQSEMKRRASSGIAARPQATAVGFNDGTADRQPHAGPLPFGRKEGIENLVDLFER